MQNILRFSFIVLIFMCCSTLKGALAKPHDEPRVSFLHAINDMPLAPKLTEILDQNIIFDKTTGRIILSHAEGPNSPEAISDFYHKTLPQLGWVKLKPLSFQRGNEVLNIELSDKAGITHVIFQLKPRV